MIHGKGDIFQSKENVSREKKAPRSFSWQFKEEVAKQMLNGESPTLLRRELGIVLSKLYKWRDQYGQGGTEYGPEQSIGPVMPYRCQ